MSLKWSIEPEARLVHLIYTGVVTLDDLTAAMKAVFDDPAYQPGFGFLVDRRLALTPTTDYIEHAVAFVRRHKRNVTGSRVALVVSNSGAFGMMRLAQMLGANLVKDICVFKDLGAAESWLRLR